MFVAQNTELLEALKSVPDVSTASELLPSPNHIKQPKESKELKAKVKQPGCSSTPICFHQDGSSRAPSCHAGSPGSIVAAVSVAPRRMSRSALMHGLASF